MVTNLVSSWLMIGGSRRMLARLMPIGLNQVSNLGLSENLLREQVRQKLLSSHPRTLNMVLSTHPSLRGKKRKRRRGMPGITGAQRMITTSIQLSPYDEVESIMAFCQVGLRLKLPVVMVAVVPDWISLHVCVGVADCRWDALYSCMCLVLLFVFTFLASLFVWVDLARAQLF